MLGEISVWRGWRWVASVDPGTPSGGLLHKLTTLMYSDADLRETGIVVFGSSPLEFCAQLPVNSADIDVTPDQFLDHLRDKVAKWGINVGDPYVQVLPPTVFRPGKNYLLRATSVSLNNIQVTLPHPIDIIFGKLHRLDRKDYRDLDAVLHSCGRPTLDDLHHYMRENGDIFECAAADLNKLVSNIEIFWSYLGGGQAGVNVRKDYISPAQSERLSAWNEGSGNFKAAQKLSEDEISKD